MKKQSKNLSAFLVPVSIVLAGIIVSGAIFVSQKSNTNTIDTTDTVDDVDANTTPSLTDGSFKYYEGTDILLEDGKPVIVLFSTETCPHCQWISETFDMIAKEYQDAGKIKAYHFNFTQSGVADTISGETFDAIPSQFEELNTKYGGGYVPTFVIGGKYFRVGNAFEQEDDLEKESTELRRIIDQVIEEAGK